MSTELDYIFSRFRVCGSYKSGEPFGSGHIHDTYRIITTEDDCDDYILQRLNNRIFKNIPELQENIERVTNHLRRKISAAEGCNLKRECLTLIPLKDEDRTWYTDSEGNYWRMYIFINDHRSYDVVDTPDKSFEAGKAIGRFQAMLSDLPGKPLYETIPYFHNIEKRLLSFHNTLENDTHNRANTVYDEIRDTISRQEEMKIILRLGEMNKIPLRITHNDTKFNNILLDNKNHALCVIDLDTVMPGYVHYDFGDAIRTVSNRASEDESDLSKIEMDLRLFEAYAEGYLSETKDTLNDTEKEYLAFAPRLITYTIAVRFLTDYLDGDNYFKIKHPLHNLQRAKAQFTLLKSMEKQYLSMQKIINRLSK